MRNTQDAKPVDVSSTDWFGEEGRLKASPAEIIRLLAGVKLPLPNGWGDGVVVGAWKLRGERVKILLAWPNAENPDQLFNEDAASVLPFSPNGKLTCSEPVTGTFDGTMKKQTRR